MAITHTESNLHRTPLIKSNLLFAIDLELISPDSQTQQGDVGGAVGLGYEQMGFTPLLPIKEPLLPGIQ